MNDILFLSWLTANKGENWKRVTSLRFEVPKKRQVAQWLQAGVCHQADPQPNLGSPTYKQCDLGQVTSPLCAFASLSLASQRSGKSSEPGGLVPPPDLQLGSHHNQVKPPPLWTPAGRQL